MSHFHIILALCSTYDRRQDSYHYQKHRELKE